jgi:O-antigen/teichoic acid export membrane protein
MLRRYFSFFDQGLVSGGNFLTIALCAHFLPLDEQGKFIYVFSSYIGLVLLNVSGIFQGAAVQAPLRDASYVSVLAKLQAYSALLMAILVGIVWLFVGPYLGWTLTLHEFTLIITYLFLQQLTDFTRRSSYVFSDAKNALLSSLWTYPIRLIVLFLVAPKTIEGVLIILIASCAVSVGMTIKEINRSNIDFLKWREQALEHLNYSKLFIAGSFLSWLWAYSPVFILGMLQGKEAAALLASIRGISGMANIFIEQLETKAAADWSRQYHSEGAASVKQSIYQVNKVALIFWIFVMLIIVMFNEGIVGFILGTQYSPYSKILIVAWVGYGAFYVVRIHGIAHRTFGDNKIEFVAGTSGVLAAALCSFWLIPQFKVEGAAWVYVFIAMVMLCVQVIATKKT